MKLRIGILFWLLSWIPYGVILGLSGKALTAAWTFEIAIGIIGLALAGTEFAQAIKANGWKGAPKVAWRAMLHGSDIEDAEVVS